MIARQTHLKRRTLATALTIAGFCVGLYLCIATVLWAMSPGPTFP